MINDALFAIWFLLPAAVANVMPILSAATPLLKRWQAPVDAGRTWRGKPLLGPHKTWRGFVTGTLAGLAGFVILQWLVRHWPWAHHLAQHSAGYSSLPPVFGAAIGFGALAGDALESLCKRQYGIASGKSWVPFDQLDYIIGAVLVSLLFIVLPWQVYIWIFLIWFGMHLLFTYIGWRLGLKESPI